MKMMDHIVVHSVQVCRVATCIADHLPGQNPALNHELVKAASLLHDITKTRSFKTGENHAETGCQLLNRLGYPEVGNLIRQHVRLDAYFESNRIAEVEIINYADKRVLHHNVVTLAERMRYVWDKYGKTPEDEARLSRLGEQTKLLEKKLFSGLPFSPDDLLQHLNPQTASPPDPVE